MSGLEDFPTKRMFSLTAVQLDERRAGLERYLHSGLVSLAMIHGLTPLSLGSVSGQGYPAE